MAPSLVKRAATLTRRLYASLPWGYRVAALFTRLASDVIDAFGRVVAAEFIKRGVTDMPDIGSDPAASWRDKLKKAKTRAGDLLPRSYGRKYGQMAWNVMLAKLRNPATVSDLMVEVVEQLLSNPNTIREGVTRAEAEAFVLTMMKNRAIDLFRQQSRQQTGPMPTDDEGVELDIADPKFLKELEDRYSPSHLKEVLEKARRDLQQAHPDALLYIDLSLQGYLDTEIVGDWRKNRPSMLPSIQKKPITPQMWEYKIKPKIFDALRKHLV